MKSLETKRYLFLIISYKRWANGLNGPKKVHFEEYVVRMFSSFIKLYSEIYDLSYQAFAIKSINVTYSLN